MNIIKGRNLKYDYELPKEKVDTFATMMVIHRISLSADYVPIPTLTQ